MKKLITILLSLGLVAFCSAASAEIILSDNELGELYASDMAVAAQTNIATIVARYGDIKYVHSGIEQSNYAKVKRDVNELFGQAIAVVSQTNYAALSAGDDIKCVEIEQKNKAEITRCVDVTAIGARSSAVAVGPQSNNAALVSGDDMRCVDIEQKNKAEIKCDVMANPCFGTATAVTSQTNLAALTAGGDIKHVDIEQKNKAIVCWNADVIARNTTAIGAQSNTAAIFSTSGNIKGVSISQRNYAYVAPGATL
ncbi:MAG: hypothetical protein ABH914_02430 [Candidatus Omnitrophota bacterium]